MNLIKKYGTKDGRFSIDYSNGNVSVEEYAMGDMYALSIDIQIALEEYRKVKDIYLNRKTNIKYLLSGY